MSSQKGCHGWKCLGLGISLTGLEAQGTAEGENVLSGGDELQRKGILGNEPEAGVEGLGPEDGRWEHRWRSLCYTAARRPCPRAAPMAPTTTATSICGEAAPRRSPQKRSEEN